MIKEFTYNGITIKEARSAAGLSQAAMSNLFGIPKRTIEDWESGNRTPSKWVEQLIIKELLRQGEIKMDNRFYQNETLQDKLISNTLKELAVDYENGEIVEVKDTLWEIIQAIEKFIDRDETGN